MDLGKFAPPCWPLLVKYLLCSVGDLIISQTLILFLPSRYISYRLQFNVNISYVSGTSHRPVDVQSPCAHGVHMGMTDNQIILREGDEVQWRKTKDGKGIESNMPSETLF